MAEIAEILKEGITVKDVLENLKQREERFRQGMSFAERGKLIRRMLPDVYDACVKKAEDCLKGLTILPGSSSLHFIGNPVKWHENIYGDEEYRLAVESFNGYACNQGIWRSLEVGIRMHQTWPYVIHHLIQDGFLDETFLETYLKSVYQHGRILYLVAPILWPNCLTINNKDPWEYISSWGYGSQKQGDILQADSKPGLLYAVGEHRNYEPTIHRRAVAIVDGKFLAVMDVLTDVPQDASVQIHFHMDSARVTADSQRAFAASAAPGANVTVYGDSRLKSALIPAKISTRNNVWHDTMIVRFEAEHLNEGRYGFLSVACPSPAGETAPEVTDITEEFLPDGTIRFGFQAEGCHYTLELRGNQVILLN